MKDILIFGCGGHAKVITDIVEKQGKYNIAGFIDNYKTPGETFIGYKVLGSESDILKIGIDAGIVALGDNWIRSKVVNNVLSINSQFEFVTAIHPFTSITRDVVIGNGTVIMAGSIINSNTKIGSHCIINTNSSVDHDNTICDFSSIAPGVTTGGNVNIGEFTAISLGAKIKHGITIGEHSVIGAGSVVLKNVDSNVVQYGAPAKYIRDRNKGDKYLG
jgi:sugar O-acyltransferase (sialic acid O-acetyltransferase NeuD family)